MESGSFSWIRKVLICERTTESVRRCSRIEQGTGRNDRDSYSRDSCHSAHAIFPELGRRSNDGDIATRISLPGTRIVSNNSRSSWLSGMNAICPVRKPLVPGWTICGAGIALYIVLFLVTGKIMHRPFLLLLFLF